MLHQICRDLVQKKVEMNPIQGSVTTHSTSFKCSTEMRYSIHKHKKAVHNNEKPFKCEICLKCFGVKWKLNRHWKIVHENEKPFKCEICQKGFGFKTVLNTHRRTVHENNFQM